LRQSKSTIAQRKKAAAYHVNRSAVKNVIVINSGIEITRDSIPAKTKKRWLFFINNAKRRRKKIKS